MPEIISDSQMADASVSINSEQEQIPQTQPQEEQPIELRCTIRRMFEGCPKPNGWFGCFAHVRGKQDDVKITGITELPLVNGMILDIKAKTNKKYNSYEALEITVVTKTRTGIISYLSSLSGVSRIVAELIVDTYGEDTLEILANDIDTVKDECDLSDKQIEAIKNGLASTDRLNYLRKNIPELSPQMIKRIDSLFEDPIAMMQSNPYRLTEVPGISFPVADAVALRLGHDPASPFRINHGLIHYLKTSMQDDLYIDLDDTVQINRLKLGLENLLKLRMDMNPFMDDLIELSNIEDSPIVIENYNGRSHLYLAETYMNMQFFVNSIQRLNHPDTYALTTLNCTVQDLVRDYELFKDAQIPGFQLVKEQRKAVRTALNNQICVITGGPGRGKTSMIECIAKAWPRRSQVMLLAPTGKAMNKLKTATGGAFETSTIDRVLVSISHMDDIGLRRSQYGPFVNHGECCMIIIDETSMVDLEKATSLMSAFPDCHYVFVGDIDQLPPISPGRILNDMIACGKIPVARLTQPLRNGGLILKNADCVNANDTNLQYDFNTMMSYTYDEDNEDALKFILDIYDYERSVNPDITQIALLCPTRKGVVGTVNMNIKIQDRLCPKALNVQPINDPVASRGWIFYERKGFEIPNTYYGGGSGEYTRFRVGDIVMNTKNQYNIQTYHFTNNDFWNGTVEFPDSGIFNGDCGRIIAYVPNMNDDHDGIVVEFFDGRIAYLDIVDGEFETFELGYAMTVHKSQGCEYDTVIFVCPQQMLYYLDSGFANKNIVYTAITRAKKKVTIIGPKISLDECITHNCLSPKSNLAERI